jgi:phosphoglycerate dehydrogenase-like enzyme
MKRTAFFVNTSRGRMVDEAALRDALVDGVIAGAGLDVHAIEPRPMPNLFAGLPNIIMTPHLAGGARASIIDEIAPVFANCRAVLQGGEIRFRVA